MSNLGFLCESTILPKKEVKKIVVDNSGIVDLKATILMRKSEINKKGGNEYKPTIKRNPGIQARILKDSTSQLKPGSEVESKQIEEVLKIKEKIYNQSQKKGTSFRDSLVDFGLKQIGEDDEYNKLRQDFYKQKLGELKGLKNQREYTELLSENERERLHWEKQAINELIYGSEQAKSKVAQSYDKRYTNQEKDALKEVLKQQDKQKQRIMEVRRKRAELNEDRLRKLRKMNILKE